MFGRPRSRWPGWIERQLVRRGIQDERVLAAFAKVPRAAFVPPGYRSSALSDAPIPIGCRQTVSQPYVVALSLQAMALTGEETVLDVGTGSGYQAVLLSHLAREVYTIEYYQRLFTNARLVIERYARAPVHTRCGDGSLGWPEAAPFDAIVVGACSPAVPESLVTQLKPGGRLVLPVGGESSQRLMCYRKREHGALEKIMLEWVMFVPLVGRQGTGAMPDP
jgi:protein-L-isoaspartate(D-aspartate) O-methyltransferase